MKAVQLTSKDIKTADSYCCNVWICMSFPISASTKYTITYSKFPCVFLQTSPALNRPITENFNVLIKLQVALKKPKYELR